MSTTRPPVIHRARLDSSPGLLRLLPAWLVSLGVHAVVLSLFLLVTYSAAARDNAPPDEVKVFDVEEPNQTPDLTPTFQGIDSEVPPGLPDLDRLGEQNMPGLNVPDQRVGPTGNPDTPFIMEPPPGL